jgi:6-pyruvoyl-tetrahydropterin synthase
MACLFVDQLTVIDCAYLDAARGLVGESWIVDLELEGDLDAQSMVLDFGEVKRRIKRAIDAGPDHTLLVPLQHPALHWEARGEQPALHFESARGRIRHISPRCALTLLPVETVSAEALGRHLVEQLQALLPGNAQQLRLHLRPEGIDGAHYHYVHGLKKHDGACQRIAHGHRSRLLIEVDGRRDPALEAAIATDLADAYIGSTEDRVGEDHDHLHFAYRAPEGEFRLELPREHCRLIPTDSTVECIADWLAAAAQAQRPGSAIRVRAFEGVNKGALASRSGG